MAKVKWNVIDLFSGAGGASYGFHIHPSFQIVGAVDVQVGKPSSGQGALQCNLTYENNIGVKPIEIDLGSVRPEELQTILGEEYGYDKPDVLIACPPCTGFSRTNPSNHFIDDRRNSLITNTAYFVAQLEPSVVVLENARELINGKFSYHYRGMLKLLEDHGYVTHGDIHILSRFGLPQQRERALLIAVKKPLSIKTMDDLWENILIKPTAITVRKAIGSLPPIKAGETFEGDPMHVSPRFGNLQSLRRLQNIPHDGGSWSDLLKFDAFDLLTPAMKRAAERCKFGSHPDVYGRLWWDKPAVTIKRECGHIGNGRYAHPEQDRLCSVREMAILQGFPTQYEFIGNVSNMYRHIGDAVPPIISYQLANLVSWILGDEKPTLPGLLLSGTHLNCQDFVIEKRGRQMEIMYDECAATLNVIANNRE